ncbi:hypothetical protein, partial [Nevskia soli]|uniref:hypothetical protein n=1 Tax=Nevskia soli TaxID=418856 RepID=UPI0015D7AE87
MSFANTGSFEIDAASMRVGLDGSGASGHVALTGRAIRIAMATGSAAVKSSRGVVVGHVLPGSALAFTALPENRGLFTAVTGRIDRSQQLPQLVDETSQVKFVLQGAGLDGFSGQRVRVSGNIAESGSENAPATLAVTQIAMATPRGQVPETSTAAVAASLNIVIEEGDQAVNNIKERVAREVIVKVEDENHKPVSGAAVALLLPRSGASGEFLGGGETFNAVTDDAGRVTAKFVPNSTPGRVTIQVQAQAGSRKASRTFTQENVIAAVAAGAAAAGA